MCVLQRRPEPPTVGHVPILIRMLSIYVILLDFSAGQQLLQSFLDSTIPTLSADMDSRLIDSFSWIAASSVINFASQTLTEGTLYG